jgi:hypothetical protein
MADQEDRRVMKALLASGLTKNQVRDAMDKMAGERDDVRLVNDDGEDVTGDDAPTIVEVFGPGE